MAKDLVSKNSDPYGIPGTTVTVNFTNNTLGGQAVGRLTEDTNDPRTGICQACHDPAGQGSSGPTKYWRSDGTDDPDGPGGDPPAASSHNASELCVNCHDHTDNFAGAGTCLDCHQDTTRGTGATQRRAVGTDFAKQSHHVGASMDVDGNPLNTQPNMGGRLTSLSICAMSTLGP
jgi:hypothetical protein